MFYLACKLIVGMVKAIAYLPIAIFRIFTGRY